MNAAVYDARKAWLRALAYFCACFALSYATGVLPRLFSQPLVTRANLADPIWLGFTLLCFIVEFIGYYIIWPRGTLTHGRPLHWPTIIAFGLLWGISEAQLFLAIWTAISWFVASKLALALISFFVIAAFVGLWHQFYWDLYVAPEHNIIAWNSRKVLFAHVPNLVVTLIYLAVYDQLGMFVLFQTFSLLGSTYFMRFPPIGYSSS